MTDSSEKDPLGAFLRFADTVQANAERAHRPVYAETCPCGGSVEVGRDATAAERRRIQATFYARHRECAERAARGFGLLLETSGDSNLTPITGGLDTTTECVGFPPAPTEETQA
jgi:hypothetical protein